MLQFNKKSTHIGIKGPTASLKGTIQTTIFQMDSRWYIRVELHDKNYLHDIDAQCMKYTHSVLQGQYESCMFENGVLLKIPYRYNKFEARCMNCTFYDLCPMQIATVSFCPIALTNINNGSFRCTFKLVSIRLDSSEKHPHAPLENATGESMQ